MIYGYDCDLMIIYYFKYLMMYLMLEYNFTM